tara:strand:+ start:362 stop:628 length:267 start_codon:yes stop_codon:yes gene_type:complete
MARELVKNPGRTARYYRKNKKARLKHRADQRKINKRPEKIKYRTELKKERRKRGIEGKGGGDLSHQKNGSLKIESVKANRARGGKHKR